MKHALVSTFVLLSGLSSPGRGAELEASHPAPGETGIPVSASVHLRFDNALDPKTLHHLRLLEDTRAVADPIAVKASTDLTNASITLAPKDFLKPDTSYQVIGTGDVKTAGGEPLKPFSFKFKTGATEFEQGKRLVFGPETFDRTRSMTTVLFGPDRRLYAASAFGELVRWDVEPKSGKPVRRTVIDQDPKKSRQYIDLEWDPSASADNLVLWVSYSQRLSAKDDPRHYFTGEIARLELRGDRIEKTSIIVTGLPHGRERQGGFDTLPHQPNGLCFHAGKLYQSVGSTSSSGGPANWGVPEQPLSGCILEIDYSAIGDTVDVFPASGYEPGGPKAPVKVFATGVRNALEVLAHSNGRLYTATNINDRSGPGDGVPDHPLIPGDQNRLIRGTTPDHESLYILERGRHYGFPNPVRNQFVLNGGNPTGKVDPYEISDYPIGTPPDPHFAPELMFPIWRWGGTSPNGMLEYRPDFSHPLTKTLMCCFYSSGDIAVMTLGSDGLPAAVEKLRGPDKKLNFSGPLDITQDPRTGILYIADFGTQNKFGADGSMVLLRPAIGQ